MKRWLAFIVTFLLGTFGLRAEQAPRGELLELHSCQVYIGGCIASAEATQDGRYLLRVWSFSTGAHNGVALDGVQAGLLETGAQNLADNKALPSAAVVYLPQSATPAQSAALLDWLKTSNPELSNIRIQTRVLPMHFDRADDGVVTFTAGNSLRVQVRPFQSCGLASCGEALWYTPRSPLSSYTVEVTNESVVREPLLALTWIDHGKNNVFHGRFGEPRAQTPFTLPAMACVAADQHAHE
jgi:hypothetical protein